MTTKKTGSKRTTPKKTEDEAETEAAVERTFAEIMAAKKPQQVTVPVSLDTSFLDRREQARRIMSAASLLAGKFDDTDKAGDAAREAADNAEAGYLIADAAAKEMTVEFVFQACARPKIEGLLAAHGPTPEQIADAEATARANGVPADEVPTFNPDTFPPALIAECAMSPSMTLKDAHKLWEGKEFSRGELTILWSAVWNLNNGIRR